MPGCIRLVLDLKGPRIVECANRDDRGLAKVADATSFPERKSNLRLNFVKMDAILTLADTSPKGHEVIYSFRAIRPPRISCPARGDEKFVPLKEIEGRAQNQSSVFMGASFEFPAGRTSAGGAR